MAFGIFEMIDLNRGEIYQDFTDGEEIRKSWWGLQPYSVGDGLDSINEEFIKFVEARENYLIRRPIFNIGTLAEEFDKSVKQLPAYIDKATDKRKFFENLMNLQEYLVEQKAYVGEQISFDKVEVKPFSLEREESDKLAPELAKKVNLPPPKALGEGGYGFAYMVGDKVLKITSDPAEAHSGILIKENKPKTIVPIHNIWKIIDTEENKAFYALLMDYVSNRPSKLFHHYFDIFNDHAEDLSIIDGLKGRESYGSQFLRMHKSGGFEYDRYIDLIKKIIFANVESGYSEQDKKAAFNFFKGIGDIKQDLLNIGVVKGDDYLTPANLGYIGNTLVFFDVGGYVNKEPINIPPKDIISLEEDGSSKFSTDDALGQDEFPTYNQKSSEPSIENNLDANSAMYDSDLSEDLEYNHVSDATDDQYEMSEERKKSYMPGSKTVSVKKKCRLAGKGNTSDACNQGDVKNLEFGSVNEVTEGGGYIAYHGSDHKIDKFSDEFLGAEEATDQEGPGIYFTTSFDDALGYGKYIHTVRLSPRKLVDESSHEDVSEEEIVKLIMMSPEWETHATNWAEDPRDGVRVAVDSFMRYAKNEKDLFQQIWYDFFRWSPQEFVRGMVALGYDGQLIKKPENRNHIIMYNPDLIELRDVEEISEMNEDRIKAWLPGSKAVTVKKKCRIGGLGNTSAACNQGDINNLEFSSLDENRLPYGRTFWGWVSPDNQFYEVPKLRHKDFIEKQYPDGPYWDIDAMFDQAFNDGWVRVSFEHEGPTYNILTMNSKDENRVKNVFKEMFFDLVRYGNNQIVLGFDKEDGNTDWKSFSTWDKDTKAKLAGYIAEDIDPSEAYSDDGALKTILDGKRKVGLVDIPDGNIEKMNRVKNAGLKVIGPVSKSRHGGIKYYQEYIVYHPTAENDARELHLIMLRNGGYVPIRTPEETRRIGELLGYYKTSIDKFIERHFDENGQRRDRQMVAEEVKKKIEITPEIEEYVKQFKSDEELLRSGGIPIEMLDQAAHGFNEESVKQMMPDQLAIRWHNDLENVKYEINYKGLSDEEYARSVDLSEPIDVAYEDIGTGEKFFVQDGHHRYYAAKILNKPLNVNLEIKVNPLKKLAPDVGYDDFHRNVWKEVHSVEEGVGDKYFEKTTGSKPEFSDFEDQFKSKKNVEDEEVIRTEYVNIIKNPSSLKNIGPYVRGAVDKDGNLFVEEKSVILHDTLLRFLDERGYLNYVPDWDSKIPTEFITVHRYGDTNDFILGESNLQMRPEELRYNMENVPNRIESKPYFQKFIDLANKKHPQFNFINELAIYYDQGSYEEMMNLNENINEAALMTINELPFKEDIELLGGEIYSVGGAVRDEFLGKESKDLDILVTGIPFEKLAKIMKPYGKVDAVGKQFGILKFKPPGGEEIDVAIPRTETVLNPDEIKKQIIDLKNTFEDSNLTGDDLLHYQNKLNDLQRKLKSAHKQFDVHSDHTLPIEKDLERRDFTINAIAKNSDGKIVDPFGGQEDLKNKTIRVVNPEAFSDDPLRMLRAVQFASRFGFTIEPKTMDMIQANAGRIKEIPPERILIEFDKIVKKGNNVIGAELLRDTGLFENIFGFKLSGVDNNALSRARTMGEFIYTLLSSTPNPADHFKSDLKGDIETFKEIKALDLGMHDVSDSPVNNRSVAHNMYSISPKSLESKILPQKLQHAAMELLMGRFPKTIGDLAVNGNDIQQLGFQGKEIGDKLKSLLINVYAENVRNNREDLLNLVGQKSSDQFPQN